MRYANVNGVRSEPTPKLRGKCRQCGGDTVAKCGQHVVWHWAHLTKEHCDQWWESETAWHRAWKDRFPADWQEVVMQDLLAGEKHIADVRTSRGLVVEFQRSTIDPAEVAAREAFYGPMVWVIDGTRNDSDPYYFNMGRSGVEDDGVVAFQIFGRSKLFHRWHRTTPVFVDFGQFGFWRICRFDPKEKKGIALLVNRDAFAQAVIDGSIDFSKGGGPASLPRQPA